MRARHETPVRDPSLTCNLDAAEVELLNFAPPAHLLGQLPSLLTGVQCHLTANDPRRLEMERLRRKLGGCAGPTGAGRR